MNSPNLPTAAPPDQVPSEASKRLLPWLVAFAFFMESLDTTILNTAVPAISAALHVTPLSMKAVLASYTLSLAVFIPISGWVADRFGTRRVFAAAIGLFTLGSFLCGISSNIDALVACRVLQGMRRVNDGAGGKDDAGADVCKVGLASRDELCFDTGAGRSDAWAYRRRSDRGLSSLAVYLFCEYPDRAGGIGPGLSVSAGLSRRTRRILWMLSG